MGRRRRDNAESAVKRKKLYPLPNGEKVEIASQAATATLRIVPSATKTVEWRMAFAR